MNSPPWLKIDENGPILRLYILPGGSKNEVVGEYKGRLKIKIKAPPQDGEANEALVDFLSVKLKISKKKIVLIQGETSRQKLVLVGIPPEEVILLLPY